MSGVKEMELKSEEWIARHLEGRPEIFSLYISNLKRNGGRKGKTSVLTRKIYLGKILRFYDYVTNVKKMDITDIKHDDITAYLDYIDAKRGKESSAQTINGCLAALDSFYEYLVISGRIENNPCKHQHRQDVVRKPLVYLEPKEVNFVIYNIKCGRYRRNMKYVNRDVCLFYLGCTTGLRISELLSIDIEDIDMEDNKICGIYQKGHKDEERFVFFDEKGKDYLRKWLHDRKEYFGDIKGALFLNPSGKRLSSWAAHDMIRKEGQAFDNKHITPHKMRTTCGMRVYDKTHDLYAVAEVLGHSRVETSKIYAQPTESRRREVTDLITF